MSADVCPACRAPGARRVESAPVTEIAAAWARQPHVAARWGADGVLRNVRQDVGAEEVAFLGCGACGLEFAEPMRAWTGGHYPPDEYGLAFDHLRALDVLRPSPPTRLLELGCSDGRFLEAAAALGHRGVGVDFSTPAVEAGRARGLDLRLAEAGSLRDTVAGEDPFPVVAMFQVAEHLTDPDDVLEQVGDVAADDARLLIGVPSDRRYTRRLPHPDRVGRSDYWDWPPQHTLRWNASALGRFLARHGWRVEEVAYEPFSVVGAAAHLAGLHGNAAGWSARPWRRRVETAKWVARAAALRLGGRPSGVRLLVVARRGAA